MTRRRSQVSKAFTSVPAPREPMHIWLVGRGGTQQEYQVNPSKRSRYSVYYEMFKQHPTVRAAVEKIAKSAVANGYRFIPADRHGTEIQESHRDELELFMRRSNATQLLRLTYKDLIIYGESYWLIEGVKKDENGRSGRPYRARRLHAMYMDPRISGGEVIGWRYGPIFESEEEIRYDLNEVIHFKIEDPDSDIYGLSLLDSLQRTVATDLHAMKFNEKFFENSASSGLILSMKGATKEEIERNREWLDQNYVGPEHAHRPMILEGDIGVNTSIKSPQEMQFIEGRKFNRQEILALLDVDPSKLGINEDANRSVAKEADNSFRSETISPLQTIIEEEISNSLILGAFGWADVVFEQEEASLRDRLALLETLAIGERMGVFSINMIKKELGLPTIEGGDSHFIQTAAGLIPVELVDDVAMRLISAQTNGNPSGGDPNTGLNPGTGLGTKDNPPGSKDGF